MDSIVDLSGDDINNVIQTLGLFLFALCGSFIKESYNNYIHNKKGIETIKIVISTIVSVIFTYLIEDFLFQGTESKKQLLPISLLLGILGFEIFTKISTIEGLVSLSTDIHTIIQNLIFPLSKSDSLEKEKSKNDIKKEEKK